MIDVSFRAGNAGTAPERRRDAERGANGADFQGTLDRRRQRDDDRDRLGVPGRDNAGATVEARREGPTSRGSRRSSVDADRRERSEVDRKGAGDAAESQAQPSQESSPTTGEEGAATEGRTLATAAADQEAPASEQVFGSNHAGVGGAADSGARSGAVTDEAAAAPARPNEGAAAAGPKAGAPLAGAPAMTGGDVDAAVGDGAPSMSPAVETAEQADKPLAREQGENLPQQATASTAAERASTERANSGAGAPDRAQEQTAETNVRAVRVDDAKAATAEAAEAASDQSADAELEADARPDTSASTGATGDAQAEDAIASPARQDGSDRQDFGSDFEADVAVEIEAGAADADADASGQDTSGDELPAEIFAGDDAVDSNSAARPGESPFVGAARSTARSNTVSARTTESPTAAETRALDADEIAEREMLRGSLSGTRARVVIGEGADRISLIVTVNKGGVSVEAQAASEEQAAAFQDASGDLDQNLRRHGLALADMKTNGRRGAASKSSSEATSGHKPARPRSLAVA